MLQGKKIAVTMPGYYAGKTIERMGELIPKDIADTVIFVDDASKDDGFEKAQRLGMQAHKNPANLNYGGNVKRCLRLGLESGADVVVLIHPDCQYTPALIPAMAAMLIGPPYDLCLASRTSGVGALSEGMPIWRYLPNRLITSFMSICLGIRHTEYHTGYRAYSRQLLETVPFETLANDFIFDNEMLIASLERGFRTCEVTCPTIYEEGSSSISFARSVRYGLQCVRISWPFLLKRIKGEIPAPGSGREDIQR